jgi:hypothetical protein
VSDLEKAKLAASEVLPEMLTVKHFESRPTGEQVFSVDLPGRKGGAMVTLNPNGIHACVEWRTNKKTGPGYRIFRLQGKIASALS